MTIVATRARKTARPETYLFSAIALPAIVWFGLGIAAPPVELQLVIAGILVAALGLPHGALDPLIARRFGLARTTIGLMTFSLGYLLVVALVVAVWLAAPVASLIGFLVISAAHFGSDWNADRPLLTRLITGIGLLSMPALGHRDDVAALYGTLAPGGGVIADVQASIGVVALVGMMITAVVAARSNPSSALEIVAVAGLALCAPPLIFFLIYFCALHSARHLREGFRAERENRSAAIVFAISFTVVPVVASAVILALMPRGVAPDDALLRVVFIGLAGLTVPHMILTALADRSARRREAPLRNPLPSAAARSTMGSDERTP